MKKGVEIFGLSISVGVLYFIIGLLTIGALSYGISQSLERESFEGDVAPGVIEYDEPEIVFQHDDYVDINGDDSPEFVPDMLTRWKNDEEWDRALDNIGVYLIHENMLKTTGADHGMGQKFLELLRDEFGDLSDEELHKEYLGLILPVLHEHDVKLQIHTVGIKGDFVPWDMYGSSDGGDSVFYPQNDGGLEHVLYTIDLVNGVSDELFNDEYHVSQLKLQSVLSGDWERGLDNNVYTALEYMRAVQTEYPTVEFYLGDALLQRRDYDKEKGWRDAYQKLHDVMMGEDKYRNLNFRGIRNEFDKNWADDIGFETAQGWNDLSGSDGAFNFIKSLGWESGIEFNNPYAEDEWDYERLVLRTAEKSVELGLDWDFVVVHSDEGGGNGHGYPYDIFPEKRTSGEPPTFSSVLNKVYEFYESR